MWHQTPSATVCYYKLLLLHLSYLYILGLTTELTKETIRIWRVIVYYFGSLRTAEGKRRCLMCY